MAWYSTEKLDNEKKILELVGSASSFYFKVKVEFTTPCYDLKNIFPEDTVNNNKKKGFFVLFLIERVEYEYQILIVVCDPVGKISSHLISQ